MVHEQLAIGAVAGVVFGLYGYLTKREWDPEEGFESFKWRKIGRTVVIYGAAGAIVGYAGEPITQGSVEAATASTIVLGHLFDAAWAVGVRRRERLATGAGG